MNLNSNTLKINHCTRDPYRYTYLHMCHMDVFIYIFTKLRGNRQISKGEMSKILNDLSRFMIWKDCLFLVDVLLHKYVDREL